MRSSQLIEFFQAEFSAAWSGHHTPVMLWGPPGVGKSQVVNQAAAACDLPVIDIRLSQMEPTDLRGIPFHDGKHVVWAVPSLLPDAERHGPRGVLFLDEINAAAPTVSAAAYQLILDRKLGEYQLPLGWSLVAAGNRQGDRGVTYTMPAPLANRFTHFEFDVHLDDWVDWAHAHSIDSRVVGYLRYRPERLFEFEASRSSGAFPSPRTWEFASRVLTKFAGSKLLKDALVGCVGDAAGAEFHAFVVNAARLPDLDEILEGRSVEIPNALDLQYAIISALVSHVRRHELSDKSLNCLLTFAETFPAREMGVLLVADLYKTLGERLLHLDAFTPWAAQHADLLVYDSRQ